MSLLSDKSLDQLVSSGLISNKGSKPLGSANKDDPIQAASIDLRIGEIFLPGVNDINGEPDPKSETVLAEGHTAVIRTEECLNLPKEYAAICFPPSRVSFKGLLMTNPGHVDPGYKGELRFTVINMGKETYTLRKGDSIATLLVLKLDQASANDWLKRNPPLVPPVSYLKSIKPVIDRLSEDFLNVTKRADEAVTRAETKTKWFIGLGTLAAPILLAFVTWGLSKYSTESEQRVEKMESRINILEQKLDVESVKKRVETLESKTEKIEKSIPKNGNGK